MGDSITTADGCLSIQEQATKTSVGASLLTIAVCQPPLMLADPRLSRASSLPLGGAAGLKRCISYAAFLLRTTCFPAGRRGSSGLRRLVPG
ncbi:hypothetical protein EPZ47_09835 [Pseudomonas viciae]|uniref:Uncharacterized protein n=1 Tax=Pseudomonas viciae TaxID=2505979 RepID=A0A4P7PEF2_9PSED|nr:hypothetical protein EPZ47_09835 [Pseudomonas viciae]